MVPRRVFFSFHYQEDIWRVSQVRNSWLTKEWEPNTPVDKASWESLKRKGDTVVKRWIDNELKGCGVTVVLVGRYTYSRPYVLYELQKSFEMKKGILAITIHNLKNHIGQTCAPGINPLSKLYLTKGSPNSFQFIGTLSNIFPTFDWVRDNGYQNFSAWVEMAARAVNR